MKTEFEMTLFDNPKNREKAHCLASLDIMFDDADNPLPESWYELWNSEAGVDMPWGTKVKITLEVIE